MALLLICVCLLQLCKAGLQTLQDLGPEMRLALNEDLEEDEEEEEEAILDEDGLEENGMYKVGSLYILDINICILANQSERTSTSCVRISAFRSLPQGENGYGPERDRRGSTLTTPTGRASHRAAPPRSPKDTSFACFELMLHLAAHRSRGRDRRGRRVQRRPHPPRGLAHQDAKRQRPRRALPPRRQRQVLREQPPPPPPPYSQPALPLSLYFFLSLSSSLSRRAATQELKLPLCVRSEGVVGGGGGLANNNAE